MTRCEACKSYFTGVTPFDTHRTGDFGLANSRRCMTVVEMLECGLTQNKRGEWGRIGSVGERTIHHNAPVTLRETPTVPLAS